MQAGKKQEKGDDIIKKKILILLFSLAFFTGVMLASVEATTETVTASGLQVYYDNGSCSYDVSNDQIIIQSGGTYSIIGDGETSTTSTTIKVTASDSNPVTIILDKVNIVSYDASPLEISGSSNVTIVLSGTNTLDASNTSGCAGLQKTSTNRLEITSNDGDGSTEGTLDATGGSNAAGIGGG
ncbi:MAG: carbohydrate-binding domain-containing protein, partial [Clostridiales bacterium]|nr:carbohydrate-binding domain-containing protein [Clostridiales bacterium]